MVSGGTKFQPVYVGDVAEAIVRALDAPEAAGRTFELGGPRVASFRELMELMLAEIARPLPVCADESCHDRASLPDLKGKYDIANIKLDKTGGLTEALALKDAAISEGYGLMIGCMVGSSLAMAPAVLLAQDADWVDLDGPLLMAKDRSPGLVYTGSLVSPTHNAQAKGIQFDEAFSIFLVIAACGVKAYEFFAIK